jgi:hypothetical protein
MSRQPERRLQSLKASILLGVILGLFSGGFMFWGTLLLGHARPIWMEFAYALPSALIGVAVGAIAGLIIDFARGLRNTGHSAP